MDEASALIADAVMALAEALEGAGAAIAASIDRLAGAPCLACQGRGRVAGNDLCEACDGTGWKRPRAPKVDP